MIHQLLVRCLVDRLNAIVADRFFETSCVPVRKADHDSHLVDSFNAEFSN